MKQQQVSEERTPSEQKDTVSSTKMEVTYPLTPFYILYGPAHRNLDEPKAELEACLTSFAEARNRFMEHKSFITKQSHYSASPRRTVL